MKAYTATFYTACGKSEGFDKTHVHDLPVDEDYLRLMVMRGKHLRPFTEYIIGDFKAFDYEGYRYVTAILRRPEAVSVEVCVACDKGED